MTQKMLPIGIDDFRELRKEHYYYVDKTLFIKEILDRRGKVNLFTRPRRFGKTLNLSMLQYFFENTEYTLDEQKNKSLFEGLAIMQAGEEYTKHLVGVLSGLEGYALDSNKKHGSGRPDILLMPFDPERPAVIIEIKRAEKFGQMEERCKSALAQINERAYAAELEEEGYKKIRKYGICFCKKNCVVRV